MYMGECTWVNGYLGKWVGESIGRCVNEYMGDWVGG